MPILCRTLKSSKVWKKLTSKVSETKIAIFGEAGGEEEVGLR